MSAMASQIIGVSIVCSTVCSGADQRTYQSSASLAFVWWIHRLTVNSPHKGPVTRKMFPFDDVIIKQYVRWFTSYCCSGLIWDEFTPTCPSTGFNQIPAEVDVWMNNHIKYFACMSIQIHTLLLVNHVSKMRPEFAKYTWYNRLKRRPHCINDPANAPGCYVGAWIVSVLLGQRWRLCCLI